MVNALIRKLELFGPLPQDDRRLLDELTGHTRTIECQQDIVRAGEAPCGAFVILKGFAYRYKTVTPDKRQIFAYLLPGDVGELTAEALVTMDHSVATFSPCTLAEIPQRYIGDLFGRPALARALELTALTELAILREWIVNVGARDAETRIAHLLCEMYVRLALVGHAQDGRCELPVTQAEIADTLSLSAVHVNRSLKVLRTENLVTFNRGQLAIPDLQRLQAMSGFDSSYLHLPGEV